jgi:hypothetical protein
MKTEMFVVPRKGANPPYICKAVYKTASSQDAENFRQMLAAEYAARERRECYARIAEAAAAAPVVTEEFLREWACKYLW